MFVTAKNGPHVGRDLNRPAAFAVVAVAYLIALSAAVAAGWTVRGWHPLSVVAGAGRIPTRALAFALVSVFLGEAFLTALLPGLRYVSIRSYTVGIMHGLDETTFAALEANALTLPVALAGAGVVTVAFFLLTVRRLRRMDVP